MQVPVQITFRGFPSSEAISSRIEQKVHKLEQRFGRITSCRVVIEAPHQHHHKGKTYHVSVDIVVPGAELPATRDAGRNHAHEDVYVALRDAFDAVQRRLQDHMQRKHGDEKWHDSNSVRRAAE